MKNRTLPKGFSLFHWTLALFCLPILLCPLAILISQNLSRNTHLVQWQENLLYAFFWGYPLLLAIIARIAFKLHSYHPKQAYRLLFIATIVFYTILIWAAKVGFN